MEPKSLFIVSQARSGSTSLQKVCCQMLKFKDGHEHLNKRHLESFFPELYSLKFPDGFPYWASVEYWPVMKNVSLQFIDNWVIRDVCQQTFVVNNLSWIKEHFNVLYLERPIDEVIFTNQRKGWGWQHLRAMREVLNRVNWEHRIDFHEYIHDPTVLPKILESMYGYCHAYNYIDEQFITKRTEVLSRRLT